MDGGRGCGDAEVDAFAATNLVSFVAWDLIVRMQHDPDAQWTVTELCTSLARPEADLEPALDHCVATAVVESRIGDDGVVRYALTADEGTRRVVARFVAAAAGRGARLEFVRTVLGRAGS